MKDFWRRFEELRKALGMTQREVSEASGFSKTRVEAWLVRKPQPIPKGDDCVALAKTLGTSVEYLVTGEEYNDDEEVGKASGLLPSDDSLLKSIADDKDFYEAVQLMHDNRRIIHAVLALAGMQPNHLKSRNQEASKPNKIEA